MRKANEEREDKSYKGIYLFLILAIIVLCIILLYLVGIMFFPAFAKATLKVPFVSQVTNMLVGDMEHKENFKKILKDTQEETTEKTIKSTEEVVTTMLKEQPKADESYLEDAIFLGDSRTVAMVTYGYVNEMQTLAEVGLCHVNAEDNMYTFNTTGLCYNMYNYLTQYPAEVIYISYGINGVSYTDEETYKSAYEKLVDDVMDWTADSKIVIQSIWPVREGYASTNNITNAKVDEYNEFLYELAQEKGIYYLDTQSILKDDYNSMKQEYNSGDGLHYNEQAYEAIFDYILTHPVI